ADSCIMRIGDCLAMMTKHPVILGHLALAVGAIPKGVAFDCPAFVTVLFEVGHHYWLTQSIFLIAWNSARRHGHRRPIGANDRSVDAHAEFGVVVRRADMVAKIAKERRFDWIVRGILHRVGHYRRGDC